MIFRIQSYIVITSTLCCMFLNYQFLDSNILFEGTLNKKFIGSNTCSKKIATN